MKLALPTISDDNDDDRVSRFDVERFACGELSGDDAARVQRALDTDAELRAFHDELKAADAAFAILSPAPAAVARITTTTTKPSFLHTLRAWLSLPMLTAGAAAAIVVVVVSIGDGDGESSTRTKGGDGAPAITFFVKDNDSARTGTAGEALRAGDRIQLAVSNAHDKKAVVVVGVDGRGEVSVYAALPAHTTKGIQAAPQPLPTALVLDDSVGVERFFAVYGDDIAATERAATAAATELAARVKNGDTDLANTQALALDSAYMQTSVHITKVP